MKWYQISQEILWETEIDGDPVIFCAEKISDNAVEMSLSEPGGIVKNKYSAALKLLSNPLLAALAATYVSSAYNNYVKNKRYTTHFIAKNSQEKQFYTKVVNDLMKTGHYRRVKQTYVDGGTMWVLQRKD